MRSCTIVVEIEKAGYVSKSAVITVHVGYYMFTAKYVTRRTVDNFMRKQANLCRLTVLWKFDSSCLSTIAASVHDIGPINHVCVRVCISL